jgi:uncharacterized membrane protein HdeD (DUF308 family)
MTEPPQGKPFDPSFLSVDQIRQRMTFEAITLLVLGIVAIFAPIVPLPYAPIILGVLLIANGLVRVVHGFEHQYRPGVGWLVLSSMLYVGAGLTILWAPLIGAWSLSVTAVVGALFIFGAVAKAVRSYQVQATGGTGWLLFDAIISAFLGILLLTGLPGLAFWGLSVIVGVDLIIGGTTLIGLLSRSKGAPSR